MTPQIQFIDILRSVAGLKVKCIKIIDLVIGGSIAFLLPSLSIKKIPSKFKKILIIRPGGIGDAVFLLPIFKVLKDQKIEIDVLCEGRNAEVFTSQSHLINNVYLYDKQFFDIFKNSYDLIIDTEQWHYLSALTGYFIKAPYKIGFTTRPLRAKLFNKQVLYGENEHELNNFKRLFEELIPLQFPNTINDSFNVPESMKRWALEHIPERSVSIFLGSSIFIRRLDLDQISSIIHAVLGKDCTPVLLGGKDVKSISKQVLMKIKAPQIMDFVGKISLIESAALIQRSKQFIGPDSGLLHLACAVGTPVIGVFGPGNLPKWAPIGDQHRIVTENVVCSPCTRFGYTLPTCKGSYHCMKKIKINQVILALNG